MCKHGCIKTGFTTNNYNIDSSMIDFCIKRHVFELNA